MNTFTRAASALLVAFSLAGCLGSSDPNAAAKEAVAFCNGYVGAIQRLTAYKTAGLLTPQEITTIDGAATVLSAHCSAPLPPPPTTALIGALDQIILIQLSKRN